MRPYVIYNLVPKDLYVLAGPYSMPGIRQRGSTFGKTGHPVGMLGRLGGY